MRPNLSNGQVQRPTSRVRDLALGRALGSLAAAFLGATVLAWVILSFTWPDVRASIHVRWKPDLTDARRLELERSLHLVKGHHLEGTTWRYRLANASPSNINAIVQNELVEDTAHLNRTRHRLRFDMDRSRQILLSSVAIGAAASVLLLVIIGYRRQDMPFAVSWSQLLAALSPTAGSEAASDSMAATTQSPSVVPEPAAAPMTLPLHGFREAGAVLLAGVLATAAMTSFARAPLVAAAAALVVVYVCGYLVGSLLVDRVDDEPRLSWAVIRTVAGLLLTTVGFLMSLALSLPWLLGPVTLVAVAVGRGGRAVFSLPHPVIRFGWDGVGAAILAVVLLSPILISAFYMAPGSFPPVFYNVDTAYFLEKVHAFVAANTYPPPSLSNVDGLRTYHFGIHAMAAFISRVSGLSAHHSVFLIVLPLLTAGVLAAAVAVARCVSPMLPRSLTVPLLLIAVPPLTYPFCQQVASRLWTAATSHPHSMKAVIGPYAFWGVVSNQGQSLGANFLILASLAGIAAAPARGWMLPAFLIGTGILVKVPAGVALLVGFVLAETWQAVVAKRLQPSPQLLAVAAVFLVTCLMFWILPPVDADFRLQLFPLYQLRDVISRGGVPGFSADVLWLSLPLVIVWTARKRRPPILWFAVAPFLVVNATRMIDMREGGGGDDQDWLQILHSAPVLLHAFALALAGRRWDAIGRGRRVAFLVTLAAATIPVAAIAAGYSVRLLRPPHRGYEFVDNRPLAEALAVIPTRGTIIVTNDLRYPAQRFKRRDRQMQIPALFGHQAFAVNYAYEVYPFSGRRRELQKLLERPEWSDAISEAARMYRWTHLVIRKDYVHPTPIPLEPIFENELYAVFRFPREPS